MRITQVDLDALRKPERGTKRQRFVRYLLSYYGRGGMYAFRPAMRNSEANHAFALLNSAARAGDLEEIGVPKGGEIEGDTVDREMARDIVLLMRDPTALGQSESLARRVFQRHAHKRWQSRRPDLRIVRRGPRRLG